MCVIFQQQRPRRGKLCFEIGRNQRLKVVAASNMINRHNTGRDRRLLRGNPTPDASRGLFNSSFVEPLSAHFSERIIEYLANFSVSSFHRYPPTSG